MAPKPGQCKLPGIVWGREGGGEGGGNLAGGQAAVSTCLLPAPLPQNRFGQSGVQEGGWNNGSPMPRRGSEGPQTDTLKMGRHCFSSQETGHLLLELPECEAAQGFPWAGEHPGAFAGSLSSLGLLRDLESSLVS